MEISSAPGPGEARCLVVTGMHCSGTSLLASLLRAAGVGLGLGGDPSPAGEANPTGRGEDGDFLALQREMLHACTLAESGWRDWGWTESQRLELSRLASFRPRAAALIDGRAAGTRPWGWQDPRTTLLLDFWDELLPGARYVFVYRAVWEVAAALAALRCQPFLEHPAFAPRIWSFYNRQLLDFYRRHRDRCLLLELSSLLARPDEALARIRAKLGVPLAGSPDGGALLAGAGGETMPADTRSTPGMRRLSARIYPREAEVWSELERAADLPAPRELVPEPAAAAGGPRPAVQESPTFTVVIPCFNHGEFVLGAVASAEDGEDVPRELVIVNDGSTDPFTIEMLERLRAAGYRVLDQPNRGAGAARNTGIRNARGRYILPLDADNRIRPAYLCRAAEVFEASPAVGVVYGDAALTGQPSGLWRMPEFDLEAMATGNRIDACGAFRRELWEQCGGYDEDLQLGWEDWDFWLSAAEKGWRFVHVPEVLFEYRLQSASISPSGARQEGRRRMLEVIIGKHPAIYQPRLPRMFAEKDAHWRQAEARAALLEKDLTEARGNLAAARSSLDATRDVLEAARGELHRFRERVAFMSDTRAWRLRSRLLRWRAALGLLRRPGGRRRERVTKPSPAEPK